MHWNEETFWRALPYLLPIITFIIGWIHQNVKLPKAITKLLTDPAVMQLVHNEIAALEVSAMTDMQKQEVARGVLRTFLATHVGEILSDNTINLLIEKAIADRKAEE